MLNGNPSGLAATSPNTGEEYIKKLLSPCVRETSNEVAERFPLNEERSLVATLAQDDKLAYTQP